MSTAVMTTNNSLIEAIVAELLHRNEMILKELIEPDKKHASNLDKKVAEYEEKKVNE